MNSLSSSKSVRIWIYVDGYRSAMAIKNIKPRYGQLPSKRRIIFGGYGGMMQSDTDMRAYFPYHAI